MKHMTLKEITAACGGNYYGNDTDFEKEVTGVAIDSRQIEEGFLFVALKGERSDGHSFIPQVMQSGALCALSEQELGDVPYPYILVKSTHQALKDLAEHYRKALDLKVIGITGSIGKTSTKEMIASVLSRKYCVLKTEGNFNNEIGLPLTVFRLREEHQIAVLEMGISHFGDMEPLARIARPDICLITNIGYAHLENLKDQDGILKEKTDMFRFMQPGGSIVLNGDDDKLSAVTGYEDTKPIFFGISDKNQVHASRIRPHGLKGTNCEIHLGKLTSFSVTVPLPGLHMVQNALAGACIGQLLGLTAEEIKDGIEAMKALPGRGQLLEKNGMTIIDDCYNANPASMKSSLDLLAFADTRKVAILGDMGELGADEKQLHYEVGAYVAKKGIDVLCCVGPLSKNMYRGTFDDLDWEGAALYFASKEEFLSHMPTLVHPGDTVLVKASHYMGFSEIVEKLSDKI